MDVVALKQPEAEMKPVIPEERINWLTQSVLKNRFLPSPDPNSVFVGDGDFRAVGAEFLGHFIRKGRLAPDARVLDIGSGIGRMAVPLTQYLDTAKARYAGIDPVANGVNWCKQNIGAAYPNFEFRHLDIAHALYNPKGAVDGLGLILPSRKQLRFRHHDLGGDSPALRRGQGLSGGSGAGAFARRTVVHDRLRGR